MALALERLGYKHCAHGFNLFDSPAYVARWEQAIDAKHSQQPFNREDWDELLGHCDAVTDMPCVTFWRELCSVYPDAKVVLVQRDEDKWFKSFSEGVIDSMFSPSGTFTRNWVEPLMGSRLGPLSLKVLVDYFKASDGEGMKANARPVYRQHYEDVRATVQSERLLEYKLGEGWKPLCDFLGKEVPDEDFPWVNEVDALRDRIELFKAQKGVEVKNMMMKWVLPTVTIVVATFCVWKAKPLTWM